jgi:hypothetical protein
MQDLIHSASPSSRKSSKKRGSRRGAPFRKPKMRNKHKNGVVSHFTLKDILKRRYEHLWAVEFDGK